MQGARFMLLGAALVTASGTARASNGIHPRTPVVWAPEPACMTIVDRTIDPELELPYTIPYEDLRPVDATDEVDDSRRHQFIAFCAGHSPQEPLPVWLSQADVTLASTVDIISPDELKPEEVLETSPMWKDCFTRITADDARRLITFKAAEEPVVWDTSGLAPGAYVVAGYTWEPVFNIWSKRSGVVKVIDDLDRSKTGPALAITNVGEIKYADEVLTLTGCVDAMDGSTITGYWALTNDETLDVLEWMPFAADTPVDGDTFELPFMPPAQSVGEQITMKIEIVDPMDRSYTAYMNDLASILEGSEGGGTGDCSDSSMNFITVPGCESSGGSESGGGVSGDASGGPTGSSGGGGTGTGTGKGEETGATTAPMQGEGGCGCLVGGARGGGGSWLLLAPWLLWARRRRG